jgi:hypothetical protein
MQGMIEVGIDIGLVPDPHTGSMQLQAVFSKHTQALSRTGTWRASPVLPVDTHPAFHCQHPVLT